MNWRKLMKRAYYEGVADGLSGYPASERDERVGSHIQNIIDEECEDLKLKAVAQGIATLVAHGIPEDQATEMVNKEDIRVSDDGLLVEMSVQVLKPVERVTVHIVAPE